MANTSTYVSTGKPQISGGVWVGPKTATVPTDATTSLGSDFKCLGFVSEDGVENANEMTTETTKAWGGMIVYRPVTELNDTFALTLIESENEDVLKTVYGTNNVTVSDGAIKVEVKAEDPEEHVFVFELALRGGKKKRIVVPVGAVTGREAITYNDSDAIGYGITISAYPDTDGNTHVEYIA